MYNTRKPISSLPEELKRPKEIGRKSLGGDRERYPERITYEDGSTTVIWGAHVVQLILMKTEKNVK